ncbi:hypothetical protein BDK51DRAFT_27096 [Blyttiomyces helicus]|uniref:Uncharacterized protein n=1 Tax=Blyttiomyces helicus TaxID=388810 RepID=A0A4V1IRI7_9FUNG|nr:hypothetical protein BDK51DRAFT_27096 [Blyttiomyces helicus]|eukprot:RKO90197.1 hypothetical protein BDK51DRAFT_27096 [Blyttiomyces helicus]
MDTSATDSLNVIEDLARAQILFLNSTQARISLLHHILLRLEALHPCPIHALLYPFLHYLAQNFLSQDSSSPDEEPFHSRLRALASAAAEPPLIAATPSSPPTPPPTLPAAPSASDPVAALVAICSAAYLPLTSCPVQADKLDVCDQCLSLLEAELPFSPLDPLSKQGVVVCLTEMQARIIDTVTQQELRERRKGLNRRADSLLARME